MKALFVFTVSAGLLAQEGSGPKPAVTEPVVVGTFTMEDPNASNLMRANAEIARISEAQKPLNEQLQTLEKQKTPWNQEMTARTETLCKLAKVPEESIKAKECTPRLSRDKDGKEVIEIVWEKKKK